MQAIVKIGLVPRVDEQRSQEAELDSRQFARGVLLSEIPGLAIGLITLLYLASSLASLM
jgi:hypothetical protein